MTRVICLGVVLWNLYPMLAGAQSNWLADPVVKQRLAEGEVIVHAGLGAYERRARVHAAVLIRAKRRFPSCERRPEGPKGRLATRREAGWLRDYCEYQIYLDPGFWVPEALVRHSTRHDLPAVLNELRARVESLERMPCLACGEQSAEKRP